MKGFLVLTMLIVLLTTVSPIRGASSPAELPAESSVPALGELVGGINQTCLLLGLVAGLAVAHANPWPAMGAVISGSAAGCW